MNKFYGDYHTHTNFSDCANTVEGVVKTAVRMGLKEVAITDHGYANKWFSLTPAKFEKQSEIITRVREKYPEIRVLHGIEADIIDFEGTVDMTPEQMDKLDIFLAGFHRFVRTPVKENFRKYIIYNGFFAGIKKPTDEIIDKNTQAFVGAIKNYPIDIITHIGHLAKVNIGEVARAAAKYGTFVELNVKHMNLIEEYMDEMIDSGCDFIVDSDSHKYNTIGGFEEIERTIAKYKIPDSRIANLNKKPEFTRLNNYKKERINNGQAKY